MRRGKGMMAAGAVVVGLWLAGVAAGQVVPLPYTPPQPGVQPAQPTPSTARPTTEVGKTQAPQMDTERKKEEEKIRDARADALLKKARTGKRAVVEVRQAQVGERELTSVTLVDAADRTATALVPSFRDKDGLWKAPVELLKALGDLPHSRYEVINVDERFGVAWVVGVGADSAKTLAELEKRETGSSVTALSSVAKDASAKSEAGKGEPALKAAGRFVELKDGKLGSTAVKVLTMERGVMLTRTEFYLAAPQPRGGFKVSKEMEKLAAGFREGEAIEVEYVEVEGHNYVTQIKRAQP